VAILEQYAIIYIPELFSGITARQKLVEDLLQRRSLDNLARNLVTLEIWEKKDLMDVKNSKKWVSTQEYKDRQ
jgi:hypothetical protein